MSELVDLFLERAIPELEQAERVGIFTKDEVKTIIKQKRRFEYKLQKRKVQLEDFERYITYEQSILDQITNFRRKHHFHAKKEIDSAIANRITKLYKRAALRFNDKVEIWLDLIKFCEKRKMTLMISGIYRRLLQLHPDKEELWVQRGLWELVRNESPDAARKVFQNALKTHPNSPLILQKYFYMELSLGKKGPNIEKASKMALEIARVIYEDILSKNPTLELCCQIYQTSLEFYFASAFSKDILEHIRERFSNEEKLYDTLARMAVEGLEEGQKNILDVVGAAVPIYEEGVSKLSTCTMWELYINFILEVMNSSTDSIHHLQLFHQIEQLLKRAEDLNCMSEHIFDVWLDLSISFGMCCKDLCQKALSKYPGNVEFWKRYIVSSQDQAESLPQLYEDAIRATKSPQLCQQFLDWASTTAPKRLEESFSICAQYLPKVTEQLGPQYLRNLSKMHSLPKLRKLFAKLKLRPSSNNLKFLMAMIEIERSQENPSLTHIRQLYEEAVRKYGKSNPHLWLAYIRMENTLTKDNIKVGSLYFQATKTLPADKNEEFTRLYTLEKNGYPVDLQF